MNEFPSGNQIRPVCGAKGLRLLHRCLPLGRLYHPLFSLLNSRHRLVAVEVDGEHLVVPALWSKQATSLLLTGMDWAQEFSLLEPVCAALRTGCLVDVGANIGVYTLGMRRVSKLPLIAYEPEPFLFQLLKCNIDYSRLPDVQARNVACGAEKGEVAFNVGTNGSVAIGAAAEFPAAPAAGSDWEERARRVRAGRWRIKVPVTTLDEDLAGETAVALLKIDCEGFEHHVLRGACAVLERHRPALFIEIHPLQLQRFGSSTASVLDLLAPRYDLDFWSFSRGQAASKLGRSLLKFRHPRGRRYPDAQAMLAAAETECGWSQFYWLGRPK